MPTNRRNRYALGTILLGYFTYNNTTQKKKDRRENLEQMKKDADHQVDIRNGKMAKYTNLVENLYETQADRV